MKLSYNRQLKAGLEELKENSEDNIIELLNNVLTIFKNSDLNIDCNSTTSKNQAISGTKLFGD